MAAIPVQEEHVVTIVVLYLQHQAVEVVLIQLLVLVLQLLLHLLVLQEKLSLPPKEEKVVEASCHLLMCLQAVLLLVLGEPVV